MVFKFKRLQYTLSKYFSLFVNFYNMVAEGYFAEFYSNCSRHLLSENITYISCSRLDFIENTNATYIGYMQTKKYVNPTL